MTTQAEANDIDDTLCATEFTSPYLSLYEITTHVALYWYVGVVDVGIDLQCTLAYVIMCTCVVRVKTSCSGHRCICATSWLTVAGPIHWGALGAGLRHQWQGV